jgi:hypothetical protein
LATVEEQILSSKWTIEACELADNFFSKMVCYYEANRNQYDEWHRVGGDLFRKTTFLIVAATVFVTIMVTLLCCCCCRILGCCCWGGK